MARSTKSGGATGTAKPRATAAGPKSRGKAKAAVSGDAALAKAKVTPRPPHLRAVEPTEVAAPAPAPEAATDVDQAPEAANADGRYKRQSLLEAVCARSTLKRSETRAIVDIVLAELGRAIDANDELNLPPLGKLSIKRRSGDDRSGDVVGLKLKRAKPTQDAGDETPLADAGEDG